ncbi:uncharacterized protein STEHIDRAFT_118154 [Stereum hirsutum FP-91666 SS1]|uniref:uncharacterized protein n=1 Tax=Stereum hirsutum (strain FP-91666) TaxID=721885 RepID=UPI000440A71C|nr:uncharacterized protein STEHIDRAFT_118154 [Stereum hirsutum FP-91666 SS1]EIM90927.1 hypothetical protein STEHIDRAFT_118154 [Stereum hirsutum FP-91666 SS1]
MGELCRPGVEGSGRTDSGRMECSGRRALTAPAPPPEPSRHPCLPARATPKADELGKLSRFHNSAEDAMRATLEPVQVYILNSDQCRFTNW